MANNIRVFFSLNTEKFEKGLAKAKRRANAFAKGFGTAFKGVNGQIGGLTFALDRMTGGAASAFLGLQTGIKGATKGMGGFNKALAASGIGLVVGAVALLVNYFTKTQEGADKLTRIMGGLDGVLGMISDTANKFTKILIGVFKNPEAALESLKTKLAELPKKVLNNIVNRFKAVGKIIKSAFNLDWDGVKEGAKDYFDNTLLKKGVDAAKKTGQAIADAYQNGSEAADKQLKADRLHELNLTKIKKAWAEIGVLKKQTRDTSLSEEARVKINEQIIAQVKEAQALELAGIDAQIKALEAKQALSENNHDDDLEYQRLLGQRIEVNGRYEAERAEAVKKINIELEKQKQFYKDITKLNSGLSGGDADSMVKGALEGYDKLEKATDKVIENSLSKWERFKLGLKSTIGQGGNSLTDMLGINEGTLEQIAKFGENVQSMFSSIGKWQEAQMNAELAAAGDNEAKKTEIAKRYAKKRQRTAIGEALIAGGLAILNALQTKPFVPLGIAAGVAAGVMTGANIAQIKSAKFARGGKVKGNNFTGDKVPALLNSGEQVLTQSQSKQLDNKLAGEDKVLMSEVRGSKLLIWLENAQREQKAYE